MTLNQAPLSPSLRGTYVRTLCGWSGIPVGTVGIIDSVYEDGITVVWMEKGRERIFGKFISEGMPASPAPAARGLLRDGFHKDSDAARDEFKFLEIVRPIPREIQAGNF